MNLNDIFTEKLNYIIKNNKTDNGLVYNIKNLNKEIEDSLVVNNTIDIYLSKLNLDTIEYIKYNNNSMNKVVLINQWYNTKNKQRQKENIVCLINNILNPLIENVILLNEEFYDFNKFVELKDIPTKFKIKIRQKIINKRLTFYDAFDYANNYLKDNIVIISNLDIFFNNSLDLIKKIDFKNLFLSLSRYDLESDYNFNGSNNICKFVHNGPLGNPCIDSNDSWIFKSPIKIDELSKEIYLGSNGCDSIINYIMYNNNYKVINAVDSINIIHYHLEVERDKFTNNDIRFNSLNVNNEIKFNPENYKHKYLLQKKIIITRDLNNVCTICNKYSYLDLKILLYSISIFEGDLKIYILTDYYVNNKIKIDFPNLNIITIVGLDKYNDNNIYNRNNIDKWKEFTLEKSTIIDYALKYNENTLFIDTDNILLNKLDFNIPYDYDLGLSLHNIHKFQTDKYGIFNAGFIYFSNKEILDKWKKYTINSRFYEQASLEDLDNDKEIKNFYFNITYNYGWWTFFQSKLLDKDKLQNNMNVDYSIILNNFTIDKYDGSILYDYKNLKTIHVHMGIDYNDYQNNKFKEIILNLLNTSNKSEYKLLLNYINNIKNNQELYKIFIPKQPCKNSFYNHNNDTFRELCNLWYENNLCEIILTDSEHVWFNNVNDILLYDRPTLDWLKNVNYNYILLGNPNDKINNSLPWIFWSRSPRKLEEKRKKINSYNDRHINSIFIGKIENSVQDKYRNNNIFKDYIEFFEMMNINEKYKYTQDEYLNLLSHSKYGLCLRGYGPKCNREIELIGLGTVPLITKEVDLTYYNDLIEGKHYYLINKPEDIDYYIYNTSERKWNEMSNNCIEWYENNCSIFGSFKTTLEVINSIKLDSLNIKNYFEYNNIIINTGKQKKIEYVNPVSLSNNLNNLFKNHNKIHTPINFDNINTFKRLQDMYLVSLKNVLILEEGLIYNDKKKYLYTLNNIFKFNNNNNNNKQIISFNNDTIVFNLVQIWTFGYYHFVIEILPRLIYCIDFINNNSLLFHNKKILFLIYYNKTFIHNFLLMIINNCSHNIEIIPYNNNYIYNIPNCMFNTPTVCGNPTYESIKLVEDKFGLSNINNKNIIIYRKDNIDRSISNFNLVIEILNKHVNDLIIFDSDNFSTIDTINLFKNANIVISPHGAGLSNLIFSNNNTTVFEFIPEDNPNLCYYHLCRLKNISHYIIPIENYSGNGQFRVNIDNLLSNIIKLLNNC